MLSNSWRRTSAWKRVGSAMKSSTPSCWRRKGGIRLRVSVENDLSVFAREPSMKAWVIQFQLIETKPLPRTWVIYRGVEELSYLRVASVLLISSKAVAHRISLNERYHRGELRREFIDQHLWSGLRWFGVGCVFCFYGT